MNQKQSILVYDTTLRDGTQGEGISFSVTSKLRLTEKMDQFGIDYIEGGNPGSNPRDLAFFEEARNLNLKHAKLTAFGSTRRANVGVEDDPQMPSLLATETEVVTIFGKSWLFHVSEVLRTTDEENLRMIEDTVCFFVENGREVIFDAEHFYDGFFDNPDYALATLEAAWKGGAAYLVLCDTNGGRLMGEIEQATRRVVDENTGVPIGIHCHNDSGVGVAVSLTGIQSGATMVQGTLNGYGERNGNANLTSIIPNLALKLGYTMHCQKSLSKLRELSLMADDLANLRPDTKAPFVGASSFAHKGGMHANAAEKNSRSYEHIDPAAVGNRRRVLISDMSGRSSFMMKARELGVDVQGKAEEVPEFLKELKELEYRGYEYEASDASFKLLLYRWLEQRESYFDVLEYRVIVEWNEFRKERNSEATVKLRIGDEIHHEVAESSGPVGALDHALRKALENVYPDIEEVSLSDFKVRILDSAQGAESAIRVQIESTDGKEIWGTVGASDNIIEASWEALRDSVEYKLMKS